MTTEIQHADAVIYATAHRTNPLTPKDLIPMLQKRINNATDEGLKDVLFWHGEWFNYQQASNILSYLQSK